MTNQTKKFQIFTIIKHTSDFCLSLLISYSSIFHLFFFFLSPEFSFTQSTFYKHLIIHTLRSISDSFLLECLHLMFKMKTFQWNRLKFQDYSLFISVLTFVWNTDIHSAQKQKKIYLHLRYKEIIKTWTSQKKLTNKIKPHNLATEICI